MTQRRRGRFENLIRDPSLSIVAIPDNDRDHEIPLGSGAPQVTPETLKAQLSSGRYRVEVRDPATNDWLRHKFLYGSGGGTAMPAIEYAPNASAALSAPRVNAPQAPSYSAPGWSEANEAQAKAAAQKARNDEMRAQLEEKKLRRELDAMESPKSTGDPSTSMFAELFRQQSERIAAMERRNEETLREIRNALQRPQGATGAAAIEAAVAASLRRDPMEGVARMAQLMQIMSPQSAGANDRTEMLSAVREVLTLARELSEGMGGGGESASIWPTVLGIIAKRESQSAPALAAPSQPAQARVVPTPQGRHVVVANSGMNGGALPSGAAPQETTMFRSPAQRVVPLIQRLEIEMDAQTDPAAVADAVEHDVDMLPIEVRSIFYQSPPESLLADLAKHIPAPLAQRIGSKLEADEKKASWLFAFFEALRNPEVEEVPESESAASGEATP